ncbi:MAG: hypothetical protein AB7P56_06160 [Nitrososphaeraceae archaeon]
MSISDFVLACSMDDSPGYFTYDNNDTMLIIQSKSSAISNQSDFNCIEPYIELIITHESLHFIIKMLESSTVSEKLDDLEVIVNRNSKNYQVTVNNMLFASDNSGLVLE